MATLAPADRGLPVVVKFGLGLTPAAFEPIWIWVAVAAVVKGWLGADELVVAEVVLVRGVVVGSAGAVVSFSAPSVLWAVPRGLLETTVGWCETGVESVESGGFTANGRAVQRDASAVWQV